MGNFGRQFGLVAATYDRVRPGYPTELYESLASVIPHDGSILEIGAGTGIATRELLQYGFRVVAVEPDMEMASHLRQCATERLEVIVTDFESFRALRRSFDAVVCAQAWHWFAGARALRSVKRLLRHDGLFGAWWNIGSLVDEELAKELSVLFRSHSERIPVMFRRPDLQATMQRLDQLLRSDLGFTRVEQLRCAARRRYEASAFVELMSTMSEVIALDEGDREQLLEQLQCQLRSRPVEVDYVTVGSFAHRC